MQAGGTAGEGEAPPKVPAQCPSPTGGTRGSWGGTLEQGRDRRGVSVCDPLARCHQRKDATDAQACLMCVGGGGVRGNHYAPLM